MRFANQRRCLLFVANMRNWRMCIGCNDPWCHGYRLLFLFFSLLHSFFFNSLVHTVCIALEWIWLMIIVGVFERKTGISIEFFVRRKCEDETRATCFVCLFLLNGTSRTSNMIDDSPVAHRCKFNNFQFLFWFQTFYKVFRYAWLIDKIPNMSILALVFSAFEVQRTCWKKNKQNKQTNKCDCLHYCYRLFTPQPTEKALRHTKCQRTQKTIVRCVTYTHLAKKRSAHGMYRYPHVPRCSSKKSERVKKTTWWWTRYAYALMAKNLTILICSKLN